MNPTRSFAILWLAVSSAIPSIGRAEEPLDALRQFPVLIEGNAECRHIHVRSPVAFTPELADAIRNVPAATYLSFNGHSEISDVDAATVANIPQLEYVFFTETGLTDAGLKRLTKLKNLKHLAIGGTKITGAGLAALSGSLNLETIILADTAVDDDGVRHLVNLPKLSSLSLAGTGVTDELAPSLAHMENLVDLNLSNTRFTGDGLKRLDTKPSLIRLILEGLDLTDDDLVVLNQFANLQQLSLKRTKVTDNCLRYVATLRELVLFSTSETAVTEAGIEKLSESYYDPLATSFGWK